MSYDAMMINLQPPVFKGKEEEWLEFIVKFKTLLLMKGCADAIQTNINPNHLL